MLHRLKPKTPLQYMAAAIALHGVCFDIINLIPSEWFSANAPEFVQASSFAVFGAPALFLAKPFLPLLWALGLMHSGGWWAWPEPLGFVLVYCTWIFGLLALDFLTRFMNTKLGAKDKSE